MMCACDVYMQGANSGADRGEKGEVHCYKRQAGKQICVDPIWVGGILKEKKMDLEDKMMFYKCPSSDFKICSQELVLPQCEWAMLQAYNETSLDFGPTQMREVCYRVVGEKRQGPYLKKACENKWHLKKCQKQVKKGKCFKGRVETNCALSCQTQMSYSCYDKKTQLRFIAPPSSPPVI